MPTPHRDTRTALVTQKRAPTRHPLSLPPSGPPGLCLVEAVGSQRRGQLSGTCPRAESGLGKRGHNPCALGVEVCAAQAGG